MAGGAGTRLWPLSRRDRPKQLLRILEGRSLIERSYDRLRGLLAPADIYIIALSEHLSAIAEELPDLPRENFIGEPVGRDTAAAIALSAAILHRRDSQTLMGVFTADHLIQPKDRFLDIVQRGYDAAEAHPQSLVTFGIKPTEPHTGLGYVRRGELISPGVWASAGFREKPDEKTARSFLESGEFSWNSGMFVWRTETILAELRQHLPATASTAEALAAAWNTPTGLEEARRRYPELQRISIDHAVMEKAEQVMLVEMDVDWVDVGSWSALSNVLGKDAAGNTSAAAQVVTMDSRGNVLVCEDDHLIAAIGVDDLVIVHSPDATLICRRDQVQRIKELVARLEESDKRRYT